MKGWQASSNQICGMSCAAGRLTQELVHQGKKGSGH